MRKKNTVESFDFKPGRILAQKYEIIEKIGSGWEGEVYKVIETATGIERAAKFFYPERNPQNQSVKFQAQKSHKLKSCDILIKYTTIEKIQYNKQPLYFMVSEFVEGPSLASFVSQRKCKRLEYYETLHLVYNLATQIAPIHLANEYHGDLHPENLILEKYGVKFQFKTYDFFHWRDNRSENIFFDVLSIINITYECMGGKTTYAGAPQILKDIICGRKQSLIRQKFRNAFQLKTFIKNQNYI